MLQIGDLPQAATPRFHKLERALPLADLFAPFLRTPYPVLLDSALLAPRLGRFSYFTSDPFLVVRSRGRDVEVESAGTVQHMETNPFDFLQGLLRRFRLSPVPGLPPFQGGAIGYFAYELGQHLERLPHHAADDLGLPELNLGFYDWLVAQDHGSGDVWALVTGLPEGSCQRAQERMDWIEGHLREAQPLPPSAPPDGTASPTSNFSWEGYLTAVRRVKEYLAAGDVYQVNLSQRFEARLRGDSWDLYRHLRRVNAAPFGAFLRFPEVAVLSASPEEFLHLQGDVVHTRPMKGTRPRGRSPAEDQRLAAELLASEKERAENLMIVDLLRNDLGRVCVPGSVEVPELFAIEQYPTVFQMVSTVRGRLRPGMDAMDLLKASFPGGSVTGAPKIRAMEIIDELEPTQRSVYCGAIGYLGFDGSMLTSIPIRILLLKGDRVYFQVGGGIVADSDPQAEYEETLHKARGSLLALGIHE